jgi:phospholipid transport system transporter-binding protein
MTASAKLNEQGGITLSGELKFSVIVAVRQQLENLLKGLSGSVQIDFTGVHASDSSALSLWLCCQRFAESQGVEVKPENVPEEMLEFARLVGLDGQLS